ncbi:MAG: hypothetical protein N3G19_02200 [Candidatus Pacearchaeota archaeon]|nr:hypothetical protein [Candidatus Pacearchaeota archaeon]
MYGLDNYNIEENPICALLKEMLGNEQFKTFSVTKIKQDILYCYYAVKYINFLDEILKKANIKFKRIPYCVGYKLRLEEYADSIYIIGSQEDAKKETQILIKTVDQCPEGPLCSLAREWFTGRSLENFEQNLADIKSDNKKILVVDCGPIYFTKEQIKDISKLFLPPIIKPKDLLNYFI